MGDPENQSAPRDAPQPVAEQTWKDLNERFYSTAPHAYFTQRLSNLLTTAAELDDWKLKLREGIHVGTFEFRADEDEHINSGLSPEEIQQFVTAETEVLLHHVSEALLRLYLAHEGFPTCPWLAMASFLDFRKFKEDIRERFIDTEPRKAAARTFFGVGENAPHQPTTDEEWERAVDNLLAFLSHFARHILDEANLYNAAKHGFALNPGQAAIFFAPSAGGQGFGTQGPSLDYLERVKVDNERYQWKETVRWVNLLQQWSFIAIAVSFIGGLWNVVSRTVYVQPAEMVEVFLPLDDSPRTVMQDAPSGGTVGSFSRNLFLEVRNRG